MTYFTRFFLLGLAAATFLPVEADAQLGRLRQRVQERVEERIEQRAENEIDRRVDRAVDEAVDRAFDRFTGMLSDRFTSNKTTVDEEAGVVRAEGQGDITLVANQTSPARSDHLSYLRVTKYEIRGTVGAMMGNGQVEQVYLHGDKVLERTVSSGAIMDAGSGSMTVLDYDEGTYWTESFTEFGAMLDSAQRAQAEAMRSNEASPPGAQLDVEASLDVRQGGRAVIRGSDSQQHVIIVETGSLGGDGPPQGGLSGRIYLVSEVWMTDDFAARDTYREFGERLAAALGGAVTGAADGQSLTSGMLADPRVDAAMEKASEEMSAMQGLAVETRNYLVSVPEGQEFDLDLALSGEEFDMNQWAASMSSEPVEGYEKKQVTIMTWKTFISNLSADPFDPAVLEVGDLQEVPSPLERLRSMGGN